MDFLIYRRMLRGISRRTGRGAGARNDNSCFLSFVVSLLVIAMFAQLIHPLPVDAFFRDFWEMRAKCVDASPSREWSIAIVLA